MATLPDPATSRAVLIGVSDYRRIEPLPAVVNNVNTLARLLTNPRIWGLPPENCTVVLNPAHAGAALEPLHEAARAAKSALVVYYAGHGLPDESSELFLGLPDCDVDRLHQAIRYDDVRREVVTTARPCRAKIVILDCCYSGRAMAGFMSAGNGLADQAVVDGAYLMTASAETRRAQAPVGEPFTAFTGAILKVLQAGIANGPELLDMDTIYSKVELELRARNFPTPQRRSRDAGHRIAIARNPAFAPATAPNSRTVVGTEAQQLGGSPTARTSSPHFPLPGPVPSQILDRTAGPQRVASSFISPHPVIAPAATNSFATSPLRIRGVLATLNYDGEWITIEKQGFGAAYRGKKAIHRSQVVGIKVKQASALFHGFVQIHALGVTPAPVLRFSLNAGRPPMLDPYSMSFRPSANRATLALQRELDPASAVSSVVRQAEAIRPLPTNMPEAHSQLRPSHQPRRTYAIRIALRIALWLATAAAGMFELSAVILTLTEGWTGHSVASTIGANLFFAAILAMAIWLVVLDLRHPPYR